MEEEYRLHKTTASEDLDGEVNGHADDDASTAALRSPPLTPSEIPTIRISSESTREPNGHVDVKLEKPETAQSSEDPGSPLAMNGEESLSAFSNKRLCERWLGKTCRRLC